jgi:hypothetical protein
MVTQHKDTAQTTVCSRESVQVVRQRRTAQWTLSESSWVIRYQRTQHSGINWTHLLRDSVGVEDPAQDATVPLHHGRAVRCGQPCAGSPRSEERSDEVQLVASRNASSKYLHMERQR